MAEGKDNGRWKGPRASYAAVHIWVNNHFGRPQHCEHCGTKEDRMYHWANISGTYQRERTDWLRLCVPCHKRHDIRVLGGKIKAKAPKEQPCKRCIECSIIFYKSPKLSKKQWDGQTLCGRACRAKQDKRQFTGVKQSAETKALKSQKLRERWANNEAWRDHMTTVMTGNQHARKHQIETP